MFEAPTHIRIHIYTRSLIREASTARLLRCSSTHTYTCSLIIKENTCHVALSDLECRQAAVGEIKSCCFVRGPEEGEVTWRFSYPTPSHPASHLRLLHPQASSATSSASLASSILVQTGPVRTVLRTWASCLGKGIRAKWSCYAHGL